MNALSVYPDILEDQVFVMGDFDRLGCVLQLQVPDSYVFDRH